MKILKPERRVPKRNGKEDSVAVSLENVEDVNSAEDLSLLAQEEKEEKEDKEGKKEKEKKEEKEEKEEKIGERNEEGTSLVTSISPSSSASIFLSSSFPADSEEFSADSECTDISDVTDRETETPHPQLQSGEMIKNNSAISPIQTSNEYQNSNNFIETNIFDDYDGDIIDRKIKSDNEFEMKIDVVTDTEIEIETEIGMKMEMEMIRRNISETIPNDEKIINSLPTLNQSQSQSQSHVHNQYSPIMDPNEPVYMGSKKYGKLFVFWQVHKV